MIANKEKSTADLICTAKTTARDARIACDGAADKMRAAEQAICQVQLRIDAMMRAAEGKGETS